MNELTDWDKLILILADQTGKISKIFHILRDSGFGAEYRRVWYLYVRIHRAVRRLERCHLLRNHRGYLRISPRGRELLKLQRIYNYNMNDIIGDFDGSRG